MKDENKRLVQVCSECKTASCWHGEFMCDESDIADIEIKTVEELNRLGLEHKENYSNAKQLEVYGEVHPHGYANNT